MTTLRNSVRGKIQIDCDCPVIPPNRSLYPPMLLSLVCREESQTLARRDLHAVKAAWVPDPGLTRFLSSHRNIQLALCRGGGGLLRGPREHFEEHPLWLNARCLRCSRVPFLPLHGVAIPLFAQLQGKAFKGSSVAGK